MLTGMQRIARVTLSDMAAGMINRGFLDCDELCELAKRSAGSGFDELMVESRVLLWEKDGRKAAFGMSMTDEEIACELERLEAIPKGADISDPRFGIKNVSVAEIVRRERQNFYPGRRLAFS